MIYFIYIYHIHLFHGKIWTDNWPTPNISGFLPQLVRASHRYQTLWSPEFFFRLLTQLHKLCSTAGTFFIWFHFRSSFMIYFIYIYHNKNMFWTVFVGVGPPAPVSAHFLFWEILHLNLMFENEFYLHERELPIWIFMDIEYPWVKVDFGCLC